MALSNSSPYSGDTAFMNFLSELDCPSPFHVVRARILGALASPASDLRPLAVIASFWPEGQDPRPATKDDYQAIIDRFMSLWQRCYKQAQEGKIHLLAPMKFRTPEQATATIKQRCEEIEAGFIEGFWGGHDDLAMSSAAASLIDSIADSNDRLIDLLGEVRNWQNLNEQARHYISETLSEQRTLVEDAMLALYMLKMREAGNA